MAKYDKEKVKTVHWTMGLSNSFIKEKALSINNSVNEFINLAVLEKIQTIGIKRKMKFEFYEDREMQKLFLVKECTFKEALDISRQNDVWMRQITE